MIASRCRMQWGIAISVYSMQYRLISIQKKLTDISVSSCCCIVQRRCAIPMCQRREKQVIELLLMQDETIRKPVVHLITNSPYRHASSLFYLRSTFTATRLFYSDEVQRQKKEKRSSNSHRRRSSGPPNNSALHSRLENAFTYSSRAPALAPASNKRRQHSK